MPSSLPYLLLLMGSPLCLGCGEDGEGGAATVSLSWSLMDGRSCPDSGVERVLVKEQTDQAPLLLNVLCSLGYGASAVDLALPSGQRLLQVQGISAQATPLYSARLDLELEPGETRKLSVKLAFTGGR